MNGSIAFAMSLPIMLILMLFGLGLWKMHQDQILLLKQQVTNLSTLLNDERSAKQDLLNRLMSEDLRTYSTLRAQNSESEFAAYQPKSDAAEVEQLRQLHQTSYSDVTGLGETVYDDFDLGIIRELDGSER